MPVTGAAPAVSEDKWSIRQLLNSLHLFFPPGHSLSSSSAGQRDCLTLYAENLNVETVLDRSIYDGLLLKLSFVFKNSIHTHHTFLCEVLNARLFKNYKRGHLSMLY